MTLEDPIEYIVPGLCQTHVDTKIGLTFEKGLRSILRQDPDVIFLGEIRDQDTAQIAIRSAMTGHHVITTVHAPHALGVLQRFEDFKVSQHLLKHQILAIVNQKLVRKLCIHCKTQETPNTWTAKGCELCQHSGYKGRTVIATLATSSYIKKILSISENEYDPYEQLKESINYAVQNGYITMTDGENMLYDI